MVSGVSTRRRVVTSSWNSDDRSIASQSGAPSGASARVNRPLLISNPLLTLSLADWVPDQETSDTSGGCSAIIGPSPDGSAMPCSSHVWRPSRTCWATA